MKVKWGSIIVNGTGTLGGHVYSRNHYGPFARTKVNPANPSTIYQQGIRTIFLNVQQSWRTLTTSEQNAWSAASIDYPKTNSFGSVYYLSGYNLFISLNLPFWFQFGSVMTTPPTKLVPTSSCDGTLNMDFGTGTFKIDFTSPPNETDVVIKSFATRPLSAGITYVSTELRFIGEQAASGTPNIALYVNWLAKFVVPPVSGQKVFVKLVPVNNVTGDYGIPFFFAGIEP